MSIENYPRLLAAAKEFNLNQDELIYILVKNGFNSDDLKPTFKLSKEMYEILQKNCIENKEITHEKPKPKRIDLSQIPGLAEFKRNRKNIPLQKSENKITQPEEEINLKPIDRGRGKLKFFDYNKNNFGYIVDVKTYRGRSINKIRVTREMMPIKRLNDETDIIFTINDSNIGLYVSNVAPINNANIYDIKEYIRILDDSEINKCIKNSVDINITDDIEGIKNIFNDYLLENPNEEIESNLWNIGLTDKINYQYAFKIFLEKNCTIEKRVKILHQNDEYKCCELIVEYCNLNSIKKSFDLLESIIKYSNKLPNSFKLSECIYNKEFISKIKFNKLIEYFIDFAERSKSEIENIELYEAGYSNKINISALLKHSGTLSKNIIEGVLRRKIDDNNFVFTFFNEFIDFTKEEELIWCYSFSNKNLKSDLFNSIDENIYKKISPDIYFKLWVKELSKKFPGDYIKSKISKDYKIFKDAENWFTKKLISKEDFISFLIEILNANKNNITNNEFNLAYNIISYLISVESRRVDNIKSLANNIYNYILWVFDKNEDLSFDIIKSKYIYFNPDDQVKIFKKLIYLKSINKIELSIEQLNEISRFDIDLYEIIKSNNYEIPIDISTEVIIQSLISIKNQNKFLIESDLLKLVLLKIDSSKNYRFKLKNYFEHCEGRMEAQFDWKTNGVIKKINDGNECFYSVTLLTGEYKSVGYGRQTFEANPYFEEHKNTIKSIPSSKWNSNGGYWKISIEDESPILDFGRKNKYKIIIDKNLYSNNKHLSNFKRGEIPNGITFCEGRKSLKLDTVYDKEFWWCKNKPCYSKCETVHEKWVDYTLLDICRIFNINTDEQNSYGQTIENGKYYQFIGLINRFNLLLDKLYCNDCNHILSPVKTSNFGAHNVLHFHCTNNSCNNKDHIYLTHCLNGKCNSIIDSRVSKKCSNNWIICESCGCCCSHEKNVQRLENLRKTGGNISEKLLNDVNDKTGHLERGIYYCHKCGNLTKETDTDVFKCNNCNVTYETRKYNFKRDHKNIANNIIYNHRNTNDDDDLSDFFIL